MMEFIDRIRPQTYRAVMGTIMFVLLLIFERVIIIDRNVIPFLFVHITLIGCLVITLLYTAVLFLSGNALYRYDAIDFEDVVDLLFKVQGGQMSCRAATSRLFPYLSRHGAQKMRTAMMIRDTIVFSSIDQNGEEIIIKCLGEKEATALYRNLKDLI